MSFLTYCQEGDGDIKPPLGDDPLRLPILIAWAVKSAVLHYGGPRLYRQSLPFFYGLILGDFLAGGLTTLAGCITNINVYPTNW